MKSYISFICCIIVLSLTVKVYAQNYSSLEFIENKGQWVDKVKFKGEMNNGAFFLTKTGITILQHNASDLQMLSDYTHGHSQTTLNKKISSEEIILHSHAYNVDFLNAGNASIVTDEPEKSYNNYFIGNDPKRWATGCKVYKEVTYKNVYPNVDVRYYTDKGTVKYDIIVRPGGDPEQIAMKYDGVDGLEVANGELVIKTSVSEIKELTPYSYNTVNGRQKQVGCRFSVAGNVVRFKLDDYSKTSTVVIDPSIVFSTFTGSTADNWGHTATYGPDGSFYAGGIVFGNGFPVSTGAYQTIFGGGSNEGGTVGGHDIGIIKFNSTGTNRLYATYIGGNGNEQPQSIVADGQGNLVIAGRSNSFNYPATSSNFGTGGAYDIVITKLNSTGTAIIGSRKFGGSFDDGINIFNKTAVSGAISIRRNYGDDARCEVILDGNNNIYFASCTQSKDFPTTPGAFQPVNGGGGLNGSRFQDGVLIKTNSNLSTVLFSSFLGGSNDDGAFTISLHPKNNNIYVGGSTVSTDFPGAAASGGIKPTFQGGECDGFVSIISNDGSTLIKSTFIGTAGNDMLYGLQFDQSGYPYIMGTSSVAFPIINSGFTSQQNGKQFISKLLPDLSAYIYSTNFGAPSNNNAPNISPVAFFVDACEKVYVIGWGGDVNSGSRPPYPNAGTTGMVVTADAIQPITDGSDFYFFVLDQNATSQLYGSFFGQRGGRTGEHVDGGTSRFDKGGVLYQAICANCAGGAIFPTTPGAWATINGSLQGCNLAAVKIAFNICDKAYPTAYWVGSADSSWHNPLNWSGGVVPNEFIDAVINPGNSFNCVISAPAVCRTLIITPGAILTANNNLTIKQ